MYRDNFYLSDRGLMLREQLDVEAEYRVLYNFDGSPTDILLFISMKQDFSKALYRYNILKSQSMPGLPRFLIRHTTLHLT
ncbi:hypothetical protein [Pantoea sp. SGAir0418]